MLLLLFSYIAKADDSKFLSPLDIWSDSLVPAYRDDSERVQIRIKTESPLSIIRKYPIQELHVDRSRKLYSGSKYKGELYGKGIDSSNLYIVKEGAWYNPYRIVRKTPGIDPLTGLDYVLAFDQWEAQDAFKNFSNNTSDNQFDVSIEGVGKRIYEFQHYTTLGRIVLNRVSDNSNIVGDNEKEILSTAHISADSKECTYKQFEIFSKWIRMNPNHEDTLKRLETHLRNFHFNVINYTQVTEENVHEVLTLQNLSKTSNSQRYMPIKDLREFVTLLEKKINFGLRVYATKTELPNGTYAWSEKEKTRVLSFNLVIASKEARIPELINSASLSIVELSSGKLCVLNTPEKFEEVISRTSEDLAELIQYQQK